TSEGSAAATTHGKERRRESGRQREKETSGRICPEVFGTSVSRSSRGRERRQAATGASAKETPGKSARPARPGQDRRTDARAGCPRASAPREAGCPRSESRGGRSLGQRQAVLGNRRWRLPGKASRREAG